MSAHQRAVYPLFSAPVYVNYVGELALPDIKALEFTSGEDYDFLTSVDKNVLDRPDFQGLRAVVMREIDIYTRELLAVNKGAEFYITNSWVNIHQRGQSAVGHVHHNSLISGVLYLKVSDSTGDLVFHRDALSLLPFPPSLSLDMDSFNIYNCKSWGIRPKTNEICLFPSVIMHSVDANQSDEERWCLAFNVFVRGQFGAQHKLNLK